ncbi:hypothetical protein D3C75_1266160 [compost metagenome]
MAHETFHLLAIHKNLNALHFFELKEGLGQRADGKCFAACSKLCLIRLMDIHNNLPVSELKRFKLNFPP